MDVTKKMDEFANEAEALMKNILISVLLFLLTQELDSRSIYICNLAEAIGRTTSAG